MAEHTLHITVTLEATFEVPDDLSGEELRMALDEQATSLDYTLEDNHEYWNGWVDKDDESLGADYF